MKFYNFQIFKLFLCFAFSGLITGCSFQKKNIPAYSDKNTISEILSSIPQKDKRNLEYFFRSLIVIDNFGYVLLGEKPFAIGDFQKNIFYPENRSSSFSYFMPCNLKMRKGYYSWKKYRHLFPMENFIIKTENNPWGAGNTFIIIINKKVFIKTISDNNEDFQKVLKKKIVPEELLKEAIKKPLLKDVLKFHDALIGTLLGYGRDNSWKFYERNKNGEIDPDFTFVWHGSAFEKAVNKISFIDQLTNKYSQDMELIFLPQFIAQSSNETDQLKNKYLKCREKLVNLYKNDNFLEVTFKLLTNKTEDFYDRNTKMPNRSN